MATTTQVRTTKVNVVTARGHESLTVLRTPVRKTLPSEVPVIDISPIFGTSLADKQAVAHQFREAARKTGFFYIKNHGIPTDVIENAYNSSLDYFRQGDAEKKAYASQTEIDSVEGYQGIGTMRSSETEGIDQTEAYTMRYHPGLDPDISDTDHVPEEAARHYNASSNAWELTQNVPHFRPALERYSSAHLPVVRKMLRVWALSLDLDEHAFDSKVQFPSNTLTINYMKPIKTGNKDLGNEDAFDNSAVSLGSHTDWELFTVLWQDNNGGLQTLNQEGQWITVPPIEGTLVVNVGDCLQRMTNDRYISPVHRARNMSGRERISMAYFFGFGLHNSYGVLDSCLDQGEEKKYPDIGCAEWLDYKNRLCTAFE